MLRAPFSVVGVSVIPGTTWPTCTVPPSTTILTMRPLSAYEAKNTVHTRVLTGPIFNKSVCLSVRLSVYLSVCVTFEFFSDRENCAKPISTNPGSMEAGENGLTRGTCFVTRRLEVVAVTGMLWISSCILGAAGFRVCVFFFLRTHRACCEYEAALPHLPPY